MPHDDIAVSDVDNFLSRWAGGGGTEKANYQLFLTELIALLGLPSPDPAGDATETNEYVFERRVDIDRPDGSSTRGFIDLYKRGCFVLEAKQSGKTLDTSGWDKAMLAAHNQADQYVRALPQSEGRPPFIVVTDVGRSIELYAEFTCSGGTYVPYPDPAHHRIRLADLHDPAIRQRLIYLWTTPEKLDPAKHSASVTRDVSRRLAELARSLEADGFPVERVAHFLKRCLFTMFAEDVELLPKDSFTQLLERLKDSPEHFTSALGDLWRSMNDGGFSGTLMEKLPRFNGGLFRSVDPISLNSDQIKLLIEAAKADWRFVEPAIFGTLLERALDPRERHKLGAHYTPRAYVERLVMPTLIEPLRMEFQTAQVSAEAWLQQGRGDKALDELLGFHYRLCQTRVLDPACGSANFLYVALEHMKRLEGEVLNLIGDLSNGQAILDTEGLTVDPHQFLGIELNPRAAAVAEIVLWIGYLQWQLRIHNRLDIPEPILRDFNNIVCRDALITYEAREQLFDENGEACTIWDGITYKQNPATGELIPDESSRANLYSYTNPKRAEWPEADYIVGNPPFIGASIMRRALGDGYVGAVREAFKGELPDSADFVMYWWHMAAIRTREHRVKRFGLITTNSLRQTFNRRVLQQHLATADPISLAFVVPDHPWVDGSDGAAVRIAMTVGVSGRMSGSLNEVTEEGSSGADGIPVRLSARKGIIMSDLAIGADVAGAKPLQAQSGIAIKGFELGSQGFLVQSDIAVEHLKSNHDANDVLKPYMNGRDLTAGKLHRYVIDFHGLTEAEAMEAHPALFQHLLDNVRPERRVNRESRTSRNWWLFRRSGADLRRAVKDLQRFIVTTRTAKHRLFQFMPANLIAESKIVVIASSEQWILGVLSSRVHTNFAFRAGGWLGAGNDATYNHLDCFGKFPMPEPNSAQLTTIGDLADRIDTHRKRQQRACPGLTLTDMYNVLEKLRAGEKLSPKERQIYERGLVSVLLELHDSLDAAVFEAYGWDDLGEDLVGRPGATIPVSDKPAEQAAAEQELLNRLVNLNASRVSEEAKGRVRWLRSSFQAPDVAQNAVDLEHTDTLGAVPSKEKKPSFPKDMAEQIGAVRTALENGPQSIESLSAAFSHKPTKAITQVINALAALGLITEEKGLWESN